MLYCLHTLFLDTLMSNRTVFLQHVPSRHKALTQFKTHFENISKAGPPTLQWQTHAFLSDAICLFFPLWFPPLFASLVYYDKTADYLSNITRRQINRWCLRFFFSSSSFFLFHFFFITASPRKHIKGNNRSCAVSTERARGTWAWRGEVVVGWEGGQLLRASSRPRHILTSNLPEPTTRPPRSQPPSSPLSAPFRAAAN